MAGESSKRKPARTLLHQKVADGIRRDIEAGFYPRGTFLPSEADLCARFEVSRGTLRRALEALANQGLIDTRPGVGHRVERSVVSGRNFESDMVIFAAPFADGSFYDPELLQGLERTLTSAEMRLVVLNMQSLASAQAKAITTVHIEQLLHMRPHAVVCGLQKGVGASELEKLVRAEVPVVAVGEDPVGLPVDYAGIDDRLGGYMVSDWLAEWGQGLPWCVTDEATSSIDARLSGYSLVLSNRAGDPVDRPILQIDPEREEAAIAEISEWAQANRGAGRLGIFCTRPEYLLLVAKGLKQADIVLGEEAAIGCVGSLWKAITHPEIPACAAVWSPSDMGVTAAHIVIMRGVKGDTKVPLRVLVAPRLVIAPEYLQPGVLDAYGGRLTKGGDELSEITLME